MVESVKVDFERHPDVAPNVTFFLFENRAPKSMITALKKENRNLTTKVGRLKSDIQGLRKIVDRLESKR